MGCQWAMRGVDFTKQPSFHEATVMMKPGRLGLASNTQTTAFWRAMKAILVVEKHLLPLVTSLLASPHAHQLGAQSFSCERLLAHRSTATVPERHQQGS